MVFAHTNPQCARLPALDQASDAMCGLAAVTSKSPELRKRDEESLITIGQYPVAEKVIRGMLESDKAVKLEKLPFNRQPASLYAKLYAAANSAAKYDDTNEVLSLKNA